MVGWQNIENFAIPPTSWSEHFIIVPSWWHIFEGHVFLLVVTGLVFSYYSHYILKNRAGCSLSGRSPCGSSPHLRLSPFCAWAMMFRSVSKGALLFLLPRTQVSYYCFCLASVRVCRRWTLWSFCTIQMLTCPWAIWPIDVVRTSVGCAERRHDFPTILTWVRCPISRSIVGFQPVGLIGIASPLEIILYPRPPVFCSM